MSREDLWGRAAYCFPFWGLSVRCTTRFATHGGGGEECKSFSWLPLFSRITGYKSLWPPFPVHKILFLLSAFFRGEWREQETKSCHGSSSLEEITAWVKRSHRSQSYISACKDRANITLPHLPNTRKINSSDPKLNRNKMQALCTQWIIYILKKIILWGLLLHSAWISDNPKKN